MQKQSGTKWLPLIAFLAVSLAIGSIQYYLFEHLAEKNKEELAQDLDAIVNLKADQIEAWWKERLHEVDTLSQNPRLVRKVEQWLESDVPAPEAEGEMRERLNATVWSYGFSGAFVVDRHGAVRLAVTGGQDQPPVDAHGRERALEAIRTHRMVFLDLHKHPLTQQVFLGLAVPLESRRGGPRPVAAAVLFRIDPAHFLSLVVNSRPIPDRETETLLVEHAGSDVFYLNALFQRAGRSTSPFRVPLAGNDRLLAAQLIGGAQGMVEGTDYAGAAVIGAGRHLTGLPWYLIVAYGREKLDAPLRQAMLLTAAGGMALLLLASLTAWQWWRRRRSELEADKHRTELERAKLAQRFDYLSRFANDAILLMDTDGRILECNERALTLYGYDRDTLLRLNERELSASKELASFEQQWRQIGPDGLIYETVHWRRDGSTFPVEISARLVEVAHERFYQAIIRDVSERKAAEERLVHMANYDALTGLPSRNLLWDRLGQTMVEANRNGRLLGVLLLDLDNFKNINDSLGHGIGDALLKDVARRLSDQVRPGDTVSRFGGDEFVILLANVAHIDDVGRLAQKILSCFSEPFRLEGRELFTNASIGIALYPLNDGNVENLLRNADAALYSAKGAGRNTFRFFTAELNKRAERRLKLETALRQALERHELSLHYQVQVDMRTGKPVGMEALARWKHPELGQVSPAEFIPVAEEVGLILPIGERVLQAACAQMKAWHAAGFPALQISVNLSGKQLTPDLPVLVSKILRDTGLEARYLELELTESLLMRDTETTIGVMRALHDTGISFSIDDFGTGYSSLSYLKRFPIDTLKIDRGFVRDITTDPNDAAIVRAIIAMARALGLKTVAEGVETHEQLEFLRQQGCDITQGYYCSEPVSAETFTELLRTWNQTKVDKCGIVAR